MAYERDEGPDPGQGLTEERRNRGLPEFVTPRSRVGSAVRTPTGDAGNHTNGVQDSAPHP